MRLRLLARVGTSPLIDFSYNLQLREKKRTFFFLEKKKRKEGLFLDPWVLLMARKKGEQRQAREKDADFLFSKGDAGNFRA